MRLKPKKCVIVAAAAATGIATATTPTSTYYACLSTVGGLLYNVNSTGAPKCLGKDLTISWSQTGPAGTNGNTILNGTTTPAQTVGNNGDFYLNTSTHTLYGPKANGTWSTTGTSLVGPQGPAGATGATGATGAQGPAGTNGSTVLNGTGAPGSGIGHNGDFYLDTAANVLYGPKAAGTWSTTGTSLVGPQGPAGATGATGAPGTNGTNGTNGTTVLNGTGTPGASLGNNGDLYLDTAANVLYGPKAAGEWPTTGTSLVGPQGSAGATGATGAPGTNGTNGTNGNTILNGTGGPLSTLGNDGDFYIDTAAGVLYGPKANGSWPIQGLSLGSVSNCEPGPNANLIGCDFLDANLIGTDLTGTNLTDANLSGAQLNYDRLIGANLTGADLKLTQLLNADLTGANLTDASLANTSLEASNLTDANLAGAQLLYSTSLEGANLTSASLAGATVNQSVDLMYVTWLNTTCPDGTNSGLGIAGVGATCIGHLG